MSIEIRPISAFSDNYIWTIINTKNNQAIVIDAGDATPVLDFFKQNQLDLLQIWITHHHHDHIGGVQTLLEHFPNAKLYAHANLGLQHAMTVSESQMFEAWGNLVQVWQVAGHTAEHLAYLLTLDDKLHIFCGDTLFSAGCGRVFTGTIEQLFESFDRFNSLHDDTALFYPAHEYTLSNLKFAQMIEPNNMDIQQAIAKATMLRQAGKPTVPTTLADERKINPFLRIIYQPKSKQIIETVNAKIPLTDTHPITIFSALRELKNNF